MKKLNLLFVMFLLSGSIYAQPELSFSTDQIIVRLKKHLTITESFSENLKTGITEIDRIISRANIVNIRKLNTGKSSVYQTIVIKVKPSIDINAILAELAQLKSVEYAEPDYIGYSSGVKGVSPNDQYYSRQWGLKNDGSFAPYPAIAGADIEMEEGWALEEGDSTVVVGIIDSGCKLNHPELQNRIWKNYTEIASNGIDEGNNNYIDDVQGWDFANNDNDPSDDFGHGTNVTGIIGANGNNSIGYAGVDWNCKLMILKGINSSNWGYYSWWIDAIHYAVDNGANVINMSLGGTDVSSSLQEAVNYALTNSVTVVVCMMNTNSNTVFYPAAYPGVIAVGSTNPDDKRSNPFFWNPTSGSNYGPHISVVAPGNYIYGLDYQSNSQYGYYWGGTSQACPHVCGLAALLIAQNPAITPAQIKTLIQSTAEDQVGDATEDTPGWDQYYGYGRINAKNALLQISGLSEKDKNVQNFVVYPNPNHGIINLNLMHAPESKSVVTIINSIGQTVFHSEIKDQISTIHISRVPGIYCIKVKQGNEEQSLKILIN
jgi:subtilisin family serine protease